MASCNPRVAVINRDPVAGGGNAMGGLGGSPVLMGATLAMATAGQKGVTVDMKALQPLKKMAYYIDEIRFGFYGIIATTALESNALGAAILAEFTTGKHAISKSPMPVSLHAARQGPSDYGFFTSQIIAAAQTVNSYVSVRWLLPQPLYMLPGEVLQCRLSRDLTYMATTGTIQCSVGYAGRMIAPGAPLPDVRHVPWVSWFEKKSDVATVSSVTEFRNPFKTPMHIQRFTLRNYATDGIGASWRNMTESGSGLFPRTAAGFERIMMDDSLGYKIVGQASQSAGGNATNSVNPSLGSVFDYPRRSWTFGRELGSREQFNINLTNLVPDVGAAITVAQIGMIGFREENF